LIRDGNDQRCLAAGMDGFIPKPTHIEDLRHLPPQRERKTPITA
jgi:hypothetical protein